MISDSLGNLPSSRLEKRVWFSHETTKIPPLPRTSSLSMPRVFWISAAKLEARGK